MIKHVNNPLKKNMAAVLGGERNRVHVKQFSYYSNRKSSQYNDEIRYANLG